MGVPIVRRSYLDTVGLDGNEATSKSAHIELTTPMVVFGKLNVRLFGSHDCVSFVIDLKLNELMGSGGSHENIEVWWGCWRGVHRKLCTDLIG
jgi:hypothetical protein